MAVLRADQDPPSRSHLSHVRSIIVQVCQDDAHLGGRVCHQLEGNLVVGNIGGRQVGGDRAPDTGHGAGEVPLPAVNPAAPARLRPACLGVDSGMKHFAFVTCQFSVDDVPPFTRLRN